MAINRNKMYLVFSENTYPVYFPTKDGGFMFDKASSESPAVHQIHFDDIVRVNSSSSLFKDGTLRFEQECEEDMYAELRIADWREIWRNEDIVRVLKDPSMEDIDRIINFKYQNTFNRVRGIFTGMLNAGEEISSRVRTVIEKRQKELEDGVFTSKINLVPKTNPQDEVEKLKKIVADLAAKIDEKTEVAVATQAVNDSAEPPAPVKPAPKPRTSQSKPKATKAKAKPAES